MPVSDSVASGDLRASLEAIRDYLAGQLDAAKPSEAAALAKQLRETLVQLNGLPTLKGSAVDEVAKRRADRREAALGDGASEGVKRGRGRGRTGGERGA